MEIKKILQTLKGKPNMTYHFIWSVFSQVMGVVIVIGSCIYAFGVALGLFIGMFLLGAGTIAFLLLPMLFYVIFAGFLKYLPVLAFPAYVLMLIGRAFGDVNMLSTYGYVYPLLISLSLSLFGYVNIKTSQKAKKEAKPEDKYVLSLIFPGA